MQRAAEKHYVALDFSALRKSCDSLIDNRLINRRSNIRFCRTLIEQRLNIGFSEHAAARCNRKNALVLKA